MGQNKWVHLLFVCGGAMFAFLLIQTIEWIWGYFGTPDELVVLGGGIAVSGLITYALWSKDTLRERTSDIVNELTKVTWPGRKETSAATVIVIITTIVASLFLGFFDLIWSWATGVIYA